MYMALQNTGGTTTAPNRAPAAKVLAGALANERVALSLIAALGAFSIPAAIIATSTSTTTDFGALAVGDLLVHIPAVAGNADFETVAAAGTKPSAAVVGDLYVALRAVNLDANNPLVPPPPAQLTGRQTGNGGTEF
jgi:hypothetical protein